MHGIGNEHDAQTILFWVRSHDAKYGYPSCVNHEEAPLGWTYLGSGSFRSVWLSPEGVAYKVNHKSHYDYQSSDEIENLERFWKSGTLPGCRLPKFSSFTVDREPVIAVERVHGVTLHEYEGVDRDRFYDLMHDVTQELRLRDMHDENVMVDRDGTLVLVDLGC